MLIFVDLALVGAANCRLVRVHRRLRCRAGSRNNRLHTRVRRQTTRVGLLHCTENSHIGTTVMQDFISGVKVGRELEVLVAVVQSI